MAKFTFYDCPFAFWAKKMNAEAIRIERAKKKAGVNNVEEDFTLKRMQKSYAAFCKLTNEINKEIELAKEANEKIPTDAVKGWQYSAEKFKKDIMESRVEYQLRSKSFYNNMEEILFATGFRLAEYMKTSKNGMCSVVDVENAHQAQWNRYKARMKSKLKFEVNENGALVYDAKLVSGEIKMIGNWMADTNKGFTKQSNQFRKLRKAVDQFSREMLRSDGKITTTNLKRIAELTLGVSEGVNQYLSHCDRKLAKGYKAGSSISLEDYKKNKLENDSVRNERVQDTKRMKEQIDALIKKCPALAEEIEKLKLQKDSLAVLNKIDAEKSLASVDSAFVV